MGAELRCTPQQVWAALSDPEQIGRWRPGIVREEAQRGRFPDPGAELRYRCRLQGLPVALRIVAREAMAGERLRTELRLGLFRCEEGFRIQAIDGSRTRVGLKIRTPSEMALVGESLDRFAVRRFATDLASVQLQAIRDWCERGQAQATPLPAFPSIAAHA